MNSPDRRCERNDRATPQTEADRRTIDGSMPELLALGYHPYHVVLSHNGVAFVAFFGYFGIAWNEKMANQWSFFCLWVLEAG